MEMQALPRILVSVRVYVPAERRDAYVASLEALAAGARGGLLRAEWFEDAARRGFFLETYLFESIAAWSAVREGADPHHSPLWQRRRESIPEACEELCVLVPAP